MFVHSYVNIHLFVNFSDGLCMSAFMILYYPSLLICIFLCKLLEGIKAFLYILVQVIARYQGIPVSGSDTQTLAIK